MTLFTYLKNADDFYKVFWHKIGSSTLHFINILIIKNPPLKIACGIFERHLHLGLTKSEGIRKRFDYIPNRIESAKNLNTRTKIRDGSSRTGQWSRFFFIFAEKMAGSAALKQGR